MRVGEGETIPGNRRAHVEIANEDVFVDMAAVLPGVTIEKDIVRNRAAIDADENVPAKRAFLPWLQVIGAGQARVDPRRSEIIRQIEADARHRASIGEDIDVADRAAEMGIDLHLQSQEQRLPETPAPLVFKEQRRLVAQLRVPSLRLGVFENRVNERLCLFPERRGPDNAELQLDLIEAVRRAVLARRFAEHAQRTVQITRIGMLLE